MVRILDSSIPKNWLNIMESRGEETEKVVAVPATKAKTAIKSMIFPAIPSVFFPNRGRQASEYFCLVRLRT